MLPCDQYPHYTHEDFIWLVPTPSTILKLLFTFFFYPSRLYLFTNRICHSVNDISSVWGIVVWNFYACYVLYSSLFHRQRWNGTSVNFPVLDRGMYLARNFYLIIISQRRRDFKCSKNCEWHCNWSQFIHFFSLFFFFIYDTRVLLIQRNSFSR